ncbi:MAG TPA: SDR family NAD(P)-dependent oxidoreductase [bacterium]|nr:SDR family NAD(P)-dependent oxidoreductase [bacterium]HPN95821.1 SDR family NAD(P)-dependent oxidoreductase [bacterium]
MKNDNGKTAIITGAGSGIGRELSLLMGKRGACVIVCDLNQAAADETVGLIEEKKGTAEARILNVSDFESFQIIANETQEKNGSIDYLFNNAGIGVGGEARDFTINDWRAVLDVNLYGVINGITSVYSIMTKQKFGHIVNTASLDGLVPFPMHLSYTASKYAVVGLSLALRIEGDPLGVRVSVACPGRVETSIFDATRLVNTDREKTMKIVNAAPSITAKTCAKRIVEGMDRNDDLIIPSAYARMMWGLERFAPTFVHDIMRFTQKWVSDFRVEK